jgi:hypothetical protein
MRSKLRPVALFVVVFLGVVAPAEAQAEENCVRKDGAPANGAILKCDENVQGIEHYLDHQAGKPAWPPKECAGYPFTRKQSPEALPLAGEDGYTYGRLILPQDQGSIGARTVQELVDRPDLTSALRSDRVMFEEIMADERSPSTPRA